MENWKDIPGYEGLYQISDKGIVKKIGGSVTYIEVGGFVNHIILKNCELRVVTLNKKDKKPTQLYVHKLVAELFVPNPLNCKHIRFKDGDRSNISSSNLEYYRPSNYFEFKPADSLPGEIWKNVECYESYMVSNCGRVKAIKKKEERILHLVKRSNKHPYLKAEFWVNGKPKRIQVHQLVARHFIGPPPSSKHVINHKDGNPSNNHVDNLEWVTPKENSIHARDVLNRKMGNTERPVIVTTPEGLDIKVTSIAKACRDYDLHRGTVTKILSNKRKTCKGHTVRYD